jgi:hypothetical protein
MRGELKGYTLYGPLSLELLDELFDFSDGPSSGNGHPGDSLGIAFRAKENATRLRTRKWSEYKFSLGQAVPISGGLLGHHQRNGLASAT